MGLSVTSLALQTGTFVAVIGSVLIATAPIQTIAQNKLVDLNPQYGTWELKKSKIFKKINTFSSSIIASRVGRIASFAASIGLCCTTGLMIPGAASILCHGLHIAIFGAKKYFTKEHLFSHS